MPKVDAVHEEARRQQILQAAVRCFTQNGYERTTIDDVCREAEMSKGGLYTYFKSKEQLFAAMCRAEWMDAFHLLASQVAVEPTVEGKLEAYGDYAFAQWGPTEESARQRAQMAMAIWTESARSTETRAFMEEGYGMWRQEVVSLLRQGQADGEITTELDGEATAALLIAIFDGFFVRLATGGSLPGKEALKHGILHLVKRGILTQ